MRRKFMKIIFFLILCFLSARNSIAVDLEQTMDARVERNKYYATNHASGPTVSSWSCVINGVENNPSFGEGMVGIGGSVVLEYGTKVKSTVVKWTLQNDKYVTNQELTIVGGKGKYKTVKLGPNVRSYEDKTVYEGKVRNNIIGGREYHLHVQDNKWFTLGDDSRIDVRFVIYEYFGCSSKDKLTDKEINALNQHGSGSALYENINANDEYIYIVIPKREVVGSKVFNYQTVDKTTTNTILSSFRPYTKWDLEIVNHKNSSGFTTKYNVYRTKEKFSGIFNIECEQYQ